MMETAKKDMLNMTNEALLQLYKTISKRFDKQYDKTFMITARYDEPYSRWFSHQNKENPEIVKLIQLMDKKDLLAKEIARRGISRWQYRRASMEEQGD